MLSTTLTAHQLATADFFELVDLPNISEEEKTGILKQIEETVQARVFLMICEQLSVEEAKEMDELKGDALYEYLSQKGLDVPSMIASEAIIYRMEVIGTFRAMTGQLGDQNILNTEDEETSPVS